MTAAIIIPYRNRAGHLRHFIEHMTPRLHAINNAQIVVVEQADMAPFNRAKLLNVGFLEVPADYYIFHDVDMLPVRADYSFPVTPTHIATQCSQFRYRMPFAEYFGGVTLFNSKDFADCRGYSNKFWSWGGEDDEMRNNVISKGFTITRRKCTFESLHHRREDASMYDQNCALLKAGRQPNDGLTNCVYKKVKTIDHGPYKTISVDLLPSFKTARK
jgi:hypothetical protein